MKFIADAMLGKLARWLRFLGFDVLYDPDLDDRRIIRISMDEDRTVLTRDVELFRFRGLRHPVFITHDDVSSQLRQMRERLDFGQAHPLGRCSVCNGLLKQAAERQDVRHLVPDHVFHTASDFLQCSGCGKVYWRGSHYGKIRERLRAVLNISDKD